MGKAYYQAFIGTNSVRGSRGIYGLRIDAETLEPELISVQPAYNTGSVALTQDGKLLYAVAEGMTFDGYADGGVRAYAVRVDGKLEELGGQRSHGQRTCCVAADETGRNVYCCNFYDGTWSAFQQKENGGLRPARLTIAPPPDTAWKALHCIAPVEEDFVGVISLAECALVIYRAGDGTRVTSFTFPGHPFPRYFAAQGNHIYAMMQAPDDIYVFECRLKEGGELRHLQTISLLDETHPSAHATSVIRVTSNGMLVLAANRPSNTITVFSRKADGTLERRNIVELEGRGPRDFHISQDGRIVVAAMQHSDEVRILEIDYENQTLLNPGRNLRVPSPAAVAVSGRCAQ